jgi:hypothetical protein
MRPCPFYDTPGALGGEAFEEVRKVFWRVAIPGIGHQRVGKDSRPLDKPLAEDLSGPPFNVRAPKPIDHPYPSARHCG